MSGLVDTSKLFDQFGAIDLTAVREGAKVMAAREFGSLNYPPLFERKAFTRLLDEALELSRVRQQERAAEIAARFRQMETMWRAEGRPALADAAAKHAREWEVQDAQRNS